MLIIFNVDRSKNYDEFYHQSGYEMHIIISARSAHLRTTVLKKK